MSASSPKSTPDTSSLDSSGNPLRIYIVDDSPIIVHLLRELLEGGTDLEIVGDTGQASVALAQIPERSPHVAIVDIALQAGTGYDVLRGLATQGPRRPLVMMLSNFATQNYRDEALKLGADLFFDKHDEIIDLVRTITAMARRPQEPSGSARS